MTSRRVPPSYEKRLLMPAVAAGLLSAIVAVAASSAIHFLIMPPIGWVDDTTFRANAFWLIEWIVRRCALFHEKGGFSIPLAIRHGFDLASFDFEAHFDIAEQLSQRFQTIGASGPMAGLITGCIVGRQTRKVDTRTHRKGRLFHVGWAGVASASSYLSSEIRSGGTGMLLAPGIALSKLRELRNILLVGAPGSGKTRIILFLIEAVRKSL